MFYYISGTVAYKGENFVVIDASGIGYKIYTSLTSIEKVGAIGNEAKMFTHLYVREDICDLYGFASSEEMDMFHLLTSVSGVGPKAALAMLSIGNVQSLSVAIVTGDAKMITRANGVGAKVAQRVILELKDKIQNKNLLPQDGDFDAVVSVGSSTNEAVEALTVLGYSAAEAKKALSGIDLNRDIELIIKDALKKLMK